MDNKLSDRVIERAGGTIRPWLGAGLIAAAVGLACAPSVGAQTGMEYPRTINSGSVPGAGIHPSFPGGDSMEVPAPAGGGSSRSIVVPGGESSASRGGSYDAPRRGGDSPTVEYNSVEEAEGHLKLIEDSWAYERPSKLSKRIEQMHAGMFVNVIGTTPSFVQVKLKNSEIAYVPLSAVQLVTPSDKMFQLTTDSPVLRAPNSSSKRLAEVHKGYSVHVVGLALNYMKVRMKDGTEGYIPAGALE